MFGEFESDVWKSTFPANSPAFQLDILSLIHAMSFIKHFIYISRPILIAGSEKRDFATFWHFEIGNTREK